MGLFRVLLIAFLVYLGYKLYRIFTSASSKPGKSSSATKKEGEVTIDYVPKKNKKVGKSTGDYIDYEEVD